MTTTSSTASDGFRMALGTLTILPTAPPTKVDREVGSRAMVLAPLVGGLLAVVAGLLLWLLGSGLALNEPALPGYPIGGEPFGLNTNPFLSAALVVGLLAVLTRAMHLDGLADTVDGISSGKPAAEALDIMRRGDVGPFGVVTLVLVLLLQVLALGVLVGAGLGPHAIFLAVVVSRLALPLACLPGIPPARTDGLGHVVAGSVTRGQAVLSAGLAVVVLVLLSLVSPGVNAWTQVFLFRALVAVVVALLAAWLLVRWAVRRLGGVTGDVLGAAVEVTSTTVLVVLALAL